MRGTPLVLLVAVCSVSSVCQTSRIKALQSAAAAGDTRAQFALGLAHEFGDGTTSDCAQAAAWYRRAADRGLPEAQNNFGKLLMMGKGVPQNEAEAMK